MDTSNLINLGLFILTALGLAVTIWQAFDARSSRDKAQQASRDAAEHERAAIGAAQRSATAAELSAQEHRRSADALERQATIAEAGAYLSEKWLLEPLGDESIDQKWKVTNQTGEDVTSVTLGTPNGFNEQWIKPENDGPIDLARNESTYFTFLRRATSPTSATIWIFWTPADGSMQKQFVKSIP